MADLGVHHVDHWVSRGYSLQNAGIMTLLHYDLAKGIDVLKKMGGATEAEILLLPGRFDPEILASLPGGLLRPDDELLPVWKEFAEALLSLPEAADVGVTITDVHLSPTILNILEPALKSSAVNRLAFDNNDFGRDGIQFVKRVLELNPSLQAIILVKNEIQGADVVKGLVIAARSDRSRALCAFALSNCGLGQILSECTVELVADILLSFGVVCLSKNDIGTQGALYITPTLAANVGALSCLDLSSNSFNDDDATLFARALGMNTSLDKLNLCDNNFTVAGTKTLYNAIYHDESLNTISDSNHSCHLELFVEGEMVPDWLEEEMMNINGKEFERSDFDDAFAERYLDLSGGDPSFAIELMNHEARKKVKMLHALCGGTAGLFNMHYLNDFPVKLMPKVFAFIEESSKYAGTEGRNLEMLFQVLRSRPGVVSVESGVAPNKNKDL